MADGSYGGLEPPTPPPPPLVTAETVAIVGESLRRVFGHDLEEDDRDAIARQILTDVAPTLHRAGAEAALLHPPLDWDPAAMTMREAVRTELIRSLFQSAETRARAIVRAVRAEARLAALEKDAKTEIEWRVEFGRDVRLTYEDTEAEVRDQAARVADYHPIIQSRRVITTRWEHDTDKEEIRRGE
jgi:hypothetical protein